MPSIATWNVNSLRVRLPQVIDWLRTAAPDILALQETKLQDEHFPAEALADCGYHSVFAGQRTYNGVAILSRMSAKDRVLAFPGVADPQRRLLAATIGELRVINCYVPNGEAVDSEKYRYKLSWLEHLRAFLGQELQTHPQVVVLGDFNIAPEPIDVHDPEAWSGRVLFSEPERRAFRALIELGFCDTFRERHPDEGQFSWWDYRMAAFRRNLGLRIDHILASPGLCRRLDDCVIDRAPRAWERPSDHAPVIARFAGA